MQLSENARKQGALWGLAAEDWLEIQERTAPVLWSAVLDVAKIGSGTRLLDAGCGAGGASLMAQQRGAVVSGCDASTELLAIARKRMPEADLKLGELETLPFPNASFDAVLAINSLQFTHDPSRAAREFVRVTAPAGRIAVVVWAVEHCEQRHVFDAILRLFDEPPKGRGVFALSAPGEVEALFPAMVTETHEVDCPSVYPDLEIALRGQMSAGPSQRVVQIFGREKVETAIRGVLERFVTASGEVRMQNRFRCVVLFC